MREMYYTSQPMEATDLNLLQAIFKAINAETQLMYSSDGLTGISIHQAGWHGCGFSARKARAHFTVVFKRIVGRTPFHWRQSAG
jgi:hypothetical protein